MNIFVTGAKGMVGQALCANLKNIRDGKNHTIPILQMIRFTNMILTACLEDLVENSLLQAVDTAVEMNKNGDLGIPVPDYVDENVSDKVIKIIQFYTGVVNKMVWSPANKSQALK